MGDQGVKFLGDNNFYKIDCFVCKITKMATESSSKDETMDQVDPTTFLECYLNRINELTHKCVQAQAALEKSACFKLEYFKTFE